MPYTIHQAKTHLSRLVKEAEAGHEVIVMRGKKPVARIVPIEAPVKEELPFRLLGAFPEIRWTPGAFDPASDEDLREMGFDDLAGAPVLPNPVAPAEEK